MLKKDMYKGILFTQYITFKTFKIFNSNEKYFYVLKTIYNYQFINSHLLLYV